MSDNTDIINQQLDDVDRNNRYFVKMFLKPLSWTGITRSLSWTEKDFPPVPRNSIPRSCGVYTFILEPNVFDMNIKSIIYVGKATNLYSRISEYISEIGKDGNISRRPNIWKMINTWNGHLKYHFTLTSTVREAEELEDKIIETFIPIFNREFPAETSRMMRAFT